MLQEMFRSECRKERMNCSDIARLGLRRESARALLDVLIKRKLIREEGRKDWKRGKTIWCRLTRKGRRRLFSLGSQQALEALEELKEVIKAVPEEDALLILSELLSQVWASIRLFDEDVYALLPRGAKLSESTEKPEDRERRKTILKETGGKVQVPIHEKRRE